MKAPESNISKNGKRGNIQKDNGSEYSRNKMNNPHD